MERSELKAAAQREIDQLASLLVETSDWMADNPEIGLQEHQASARLGDILSEFGASVERGIAGMPTAFAARLPGGQPGPQVAIVAEYDALPEVGHGCGHNIIATAALGAGLALSRLGAHLPGAVSVIGTPAEESTVPNAGGKIPILDHGYFEGMDAAIMIHPLTEDKIDSESSLVAHGLDFAFHGHPAHAAANPHEGINALDAVIVMFTSVGLLRQQVRSDARIHGVITHGGTAPNVIPSYTACRFRVRAADPAYARDLVRRVVACAEAGAAASGARMEWREYMPPYLNMVPNSSLGDAFKANLEALGRPMSVRRERGGGGAGSTDFGNVSHRIPVSCAMLKICGPEAGWHTREVAAATRTPEGHAAIIDGAKSLAMTAIDILFDAALRERAAQEHRAAMDLKACVASLKTPRILFL
ncbi:M20 family metallopeptidase, partial [Oscillochloris sp. ZM17-4]|uniref:M20 family metallopeptidase n=1 Tax=Oscillochloris sp. ZM17-4 TaxID=2866714 RepID=UPI001C73C128